MDPTSWTFSGDVRVANGPPGAVASLESLGVRFTLDARGRLKTAVERPVNAIGLSMASGGLESEPHAHRESQLMYLVRGEMICEASNALWIVPPQSALWIPGGVTHRIRGRAPLEGYSVFLNPRSAPNLPKDCCAVSVTPLFRELLLRLATRPALYDLKGPDARLVTVLLDELATVSIEKHRLPMPSDPRLRRLVDAMAAEPAIGVTTKTWAKRIGVSERTLNRVLVEETGLSFGRWRQQLHIILAIQKLSRDATVQNVALELGYENASSFVTMFRKALGTSPAQYMANRLATPAGKR
ncbi:MULTISPECIES: AraC family transcriptional regulator [Corallococcus]|uniref:AraC family transcriptional regulator n=1 Tax=Corallococcus TaxID=83461 RepID=UPI001F4914AC|nr:helix-turn-helix transcriptional regulator [Corallococcus sp. AB032C]